MLAVLLALSGVVALHHAAMSDVGVGDLGMCAMVVCLAVLPAAQAAAAPGGLPPLPSHVLSLPAAPGRLLAAPPLPRARSSPVATVVLRR